MSANKLPLRFIAAIVLLGATAAFLHAHKRAEIVPQFQKFSSSFPINVGPWEGRDVPVDDHVLEVLGPGEFLSRTYATGDRPWVDFFVAYFPSQKTGDAIHSPKNCLPGSGWAPIESGFREIDVPNLGRIKVNRYVIARGNQKNIVYYWYQSHGRAIASEYWAKVWLVVDSIKLHRTDAALVRVITPVAQGEPIESADQRAVGFAQELGPSLGRIIPN